MSNTKRRDAYDFDQPKQFISMGSIVVDTTPTEKEKRRAHSDRKKKYKPGRAAKIYLNKGRKAKTRRALDNVVEDPDAAPLPRERKSHVWDYN
jgi:hypothetical protein